MQVRARQSACLPGKAVRPQDAAIATHSRGLKTRDVALLDADLIEALRNREEQSRTYAKIVFIEASGGVSENHFVLAVEPLHYLVALWGQLEQKASSITRVAHPSQEARFDQTAGDSGHGAGRHVNRVGEIFRGDSPEFRNSSERAQLAAGHARCLRRPVTTAVESPHQHDGCRGKQIESACCTEFLVQGRPFVCSSGYRGIDPMPNSYRAHCLPSFSHIAHDFYFQVIRLPMDHIHGRPFDHQTEKDSLLTPESEPSYLRFGPAHLPLNQRPVTCDRTTVLNERFTLAADPIVTRRGIRDVTRDEIERAGGRDDHHLTLRGASTIGVVPAACPRGDHSGPDWAQVRWVRLPSPLIQSR